LSTLKDDPRFQNIFSAEAGMEFDAIWYSWLADHTRAELFEKFLSAKIASAPVNTPEDLLNYEHLQERGFFKKIDHSETGEVTYPGAPVNLTESPAQFRHAAPLLGQHNEEIYCELLGYNREDLVKFRESEII
jgi:crotonobetainyl-CoA:carnitine CoA-transferase CaiB-like acyl-CoA transferase